jgi:hypothetical protein
MERHKIFFVFLVLVLAGFLIIHALLPNRSDPFTKPMDTQWIDLDGYRMSVIAEMKLNHADVHDRYDIGFSEIAVQLRNPIHILALKTKPSSIFRFCSLLFATLSPC